MQKTEWQTLRITLRCQFDNYEVNTTKERGIPSSSFFSTSPGTVIGFRILKPVSWVPLDLSLILISALAHILLYHPSYFWHHNEEEEGNMINHRLFSSMSWTRETVVLAYLWDRVLFQPSPTPWMPWVTNRWRTLLAIKAFKTPHHNKHAYLMLSARTELHRLQRLLN